MLKIVPFLRKIERLSIENSPTILTTVGVVGVVGTAYLAARGAYRHGVSESTGGASVDRKQRIKETYKFYIPAVITGGLTCAAVISANRIGSKRTAAIAAAYTVTEQAFSEYREKVVEKIGDRKEQQVRDEIAQDRVNRTPVGEVIVGDGKVLCLDIFSGRYFQSSMEELKRAENIINHRMLSHMYASLSDYYEQIGLPATKSSDDVGWTVDRLLNTEISAAITEDGKPCLVLDFSLVPVPGYRNLH